MAEVLARHTTLRLGGRTRIKSGVEYSDISREYSEVPGADEWAWLGGIRVNPLETTSFSFDFRSSSRDVDAYIHNQLLIDSHLPGTVAEDEFENHPLLRKYYITDRDRDELAPREASPGQYPGEGDADHERQGGRGGADLQRQQEGRPVHR